MPRSLRTLTVMAVALGLASCSMGHVNLPFSAPTAAPATPPRTLGGPGQVPFVAPVEAASRASAVDLVNDLRRSKGLSPLSASVELTRAAQAQAADLARTGKLAHIGTDGSTPLDRVRRAGYKPKMAAENIAGGQASIEQAMASWRGSESHLRNLLLPDATHMGIAQVNDPRSALKTYWTLVIATPL